MEELSPSFISRDRTVWHNEPPPNKWFAGRQELKSDAEGITLVDIDAYLGIILHLSLVGGYDRSIRDLWSQRIGDDFCQCTMSRTEFTAINTFIR